MRQLSVKYGRERDLTRRRLEDKWMQRQVYIHIVRAAMEEI